MAQQTSLQWLQHSMEIHLSHEQKMQFEGLYQQANEMQKTTLIDELIGFQIFLNEKGSITDYDWDFEKVAKQYVKKTYKK
ncbi:MAG: hypothetical protein ACOVNU_04110 [Candidatus Kapaibacteriota bacterium]